MPAKITHRENPDSIEIRAGNHKLLVGETDGVLVNGETLAEAAGGGIAYEDVQLNNAQIKALPTTYIEIVPAPGAGLMLVPIIGVVACDFAAGAYVGPDSTTYLAVAYNDWDQDGLAGLQFSGAGSNHNGLLITAGVSGGSDYVQTNVGARNTVENVPLKIAMNNASGDLTGGHANNTMSVRVWYVIAPAVAFGGA